MSAIRWVGLIVIFGCVALLSAGCGGYVKGKRKSSVDMAASSPEAYRSGSISGLPQSKNLSAGVTGSVPTPPIQAVAPDRKVIYTATLGLRVANCDQALDQVNGLIRRLGGFVQHASLETVTFRVAPDKFDEAIKSLAGMGQVLSREISSDDVTDQYVDFEVRIKTAEESRDRLRVLLAKAAKTEDLLKIESDIRRLTEEIERMKGQLRVLANQVDLATITVNLSERPVVKTTGPRRLASNRFEWIDWIGVDRLQGEVHGATLSGTPLPSRMFVGPVYRFDVPDGFVPLWFSSDRLIATTPEDFRMRLLMVEARQTASLDFWAETIKTELAQRRGYQITEAGEVKLNDAALEGRRLRATVNSGGEAWDYDLWLVRRRNMPGRIAVIEYATVSGKDDPRRAQVMDSISDLGLRPSLWKAPFTQGCFAVHRLF